MSGLVLNVASLKGPGTDYSYYYYGSYGPDAGRGQGSAERPPSATEEPAGRSTSAPTDDELSASSPTDESPLERFMHSDDEVSGQSATRSGER